MYNEYVQKVYKIAEVKYELEEEVMEAYMDQIQLCYDNEFTPTRTVDFIAERIF